MPGATGNPPHDSQDGLTQEQLRQWAEARRQGGKVRRALRVGRFQAWSISIFAGLTILLSLFDPPGLLLGIGMAITGYVQFLGAARLRRLDESAARMLGWNQLALGGLIVLYAIWGLLHAGANALPAGLLTTADTQAIGPMLQSAQGLATMIAVLVYATVAVAAAIGQGWAAWFYFSRIKHIRRYREQTPAWIIELGTPRYLRRRH